MGEIELAPGEKEKIVSQPGSDEAYNINVNGAQVYVSHRSNGIVREGKKIRAGDRTLASNLRGKPLFAKAPSTNTDKATINVDQAGFALSFQARAVQASVQADQNNEAAPATDAYEDAGGSGVDVSNGGSTTESLDPPGRADQIAFRVEGTASFDVQVSWANTSKTFSSDSNNVVDEVVPAYTIDSAVDVTITDTSAGSNTVDYDMAVT